MINSTRELCKVVVILGQNGTELNSPDEVKCEIQRAHETLRYCHRHVVLYEAR